MKWLRRLFVLALISVLLYLFWPLAKELHSLGGLFRQAHWTWMILAVAIQVVSYAFLTQLNIRLLSAFPGNISFWRMMAILPTMAFIEVTVPSAGASGVLLRARLLAKNGYSVETSTFTLVMETIYISVMMALVSLAGLWYLIRMGQIRAAQLILLALMSVLFAAGLAAIAWLSHDQQRVKRLAVGLTTASNRLRTGFHRPPVDLEEVSQRIEAFYQSLEALRKRSPWPFWLLSFGRVSLDVLCLAACFLAFNYQISPGVLLTGYGLMLLVSGLASLPGGLGTADLSLSVIYARLGAPGAIAVAAALAYRLIAWWLLRFIGFASWQVLETIHAERGASPKAIRSSRPKLR